MRARNVYGTHTQTHFAPALQLLHGSAPSFSNKRAASIGIRRRRRRRHAAAASIIIVAVVAVVVVVLRCVVRRYIASCIFNAKSTAAAAAAVTFLSFPSLSFDRWLQRFFFIVIPFFFIFES